MTKLGEMLRKERLITKKQLEKVLHEQKEEQKKKHRHGRLGKLLVKSGYADKEEILNLLDMQQNSPYWEMFEKTGSLEAYLKIKKIRL